MNQENQELLQAIGQMMDEKLEKVKDQAVVEAMRQTSVLLGKAKDQAVVEAMRQTSVLLEKVKDQAVAEAMRQTSMLLENELQRAVKLLSEEMRDIANKKASFDSPLELTDRVGDVEEVTIDLTRRVEKLEKAGAKA